jgi:hypothetical protein
MRTASGNIMTINKNDLNKSIGKSMIASVEIEKIYIPDKTAQTI